MTALIDTLFQLEKQLGIELDSLLPFAELDNIGGYHPDASQAKWSAGAIWDVEGRTLYALIRALQPDSVVEIGSGTGCSSNHIASALKANGHGYLVTIDRGNTPRIADEYKSFVDVLGEDAINWLALSPDNSIDFILEDADHSAALCNVIGELAKTKLKPGGVLMAHDAAHFGVGRDVKAGYDLAGLDFRVYLTDPSDCGWLVWQRPQLEVKGKGIGYIIEKHNLDVIGEGLTQIYGEISDNPYIDTTVLQAQEEPNATYQNPSKFQPGVTVKVTNPESKYFEQTGQVYDNYRSGQEPQAYGVRFQDNVEFWVHETDLELADNKPAPAKKRTRKPKAKPSK